MEQKNYSVVRRAAGYARYDTDKELEALNEMYGHLRLYINFFQPVMKCVEKTRERGKQKKYDKAKTLFLRVMQSADVADSVKKELQTTHDRLNPAELKRHITDLQNKLDHLRI